MNTEEQIQELFGVQLFTWDEVEPSELGFQFRDVVFFIEELKQYDHTCLEINLEWDIDVWSIDGKKLTSFNLFQINEFRKLLQQDNTKTKEVMGLMNTELLKTKGFHLKKFEDGMFYTLVIHDNEQVKKLFEHVGEDEVGFDFDLTGVQCTLDIKEDMSLAQYLFSVGEAYEEWFVHNELTIPEFEEILKLI
ncbi:hypothetical protein ACE41H_15555 [Paenibacillus enshidis]|uniref:Uncharacterized protein n=1 Tax=Paenibacillus enshidis TaxID=1458439 RepID=A0ABV5AVG1_9BACL